MIRHILEIWILLLVTFTVGCGLGSLLYLALAHAPIARHQDALAESIGHGIDEVRRAFGLPPRLAPETYPPHPRDYLYDEDAYAAAGYRHEDEAARMAEQPAHDRTAYPRPTEQPVEEQAYQYDDSDDGWDAVEYHDAWDVEPEPEGDGTVVAEPDRPAVSAESAPAGSWGEDQESDLPMMRPAGLAGPRNGVPDDLQRIRGIGKKNEELLNALGIFHFGQIAAWTPAEVRWMGVHLAFPERIQRDDWIGQATILASGGTTGYVKGSSRLSDDEADAEA